MVVVRKAKICDLDRLPNLAIELLSYHNFDDYFSLVDGAWNLLHKFIKRCIYSKNCIVIVADDNGSLVGYCIAEISRRPPVFPNNRIVYIWDVFLEEKYRHRGYGREMIDRISQWSKEKGVDYLELNVHPQNQVGVSAWENMGFVTYLYHKRKKI